MIGKAKAIAHVGAAIDYAIKREQAQELVKEKIVGEDGREIAEEFAMFNRLNDSCQNHAFSVVLSPAIVDGQQLDNEALAELTHSFVDKMGWSDRQYVAYVHHEKAHRHIHLYVNRVNWRGEAASDSYIGKKSQRIADEIAQERGLVRAKQVEQQKQASLQPLKEQIRQTHGEVMKRQPASFEAYSKAMSVQGVEVQPTINRQGQLQGFRVVAEGQSLKASQIGKPLSLKRLLPAFERNALQQQNRQRGIDLDRDRGIGW